MEKDYLEYQVAGMVDDETGKFIGYVPEDFGIWVPPEPVFIPKLKEVAPEFNGMHEQVYLQDIYNEGDPCLVFFVPEDWVVKGRTIAWKTRLREIGWINKKERKNLLDEFIALAEAGPDRYLQFAKKWGPLWKQVRVPFEEYYAKIEPRSEKILPWLEDIDVWRTRAKEVKGFLDIAAYLHTGEPAPLEKWEYVYVHLEEGKLDNIVKQRYWFSLFISGKFSDEYKIMFHLDWSTKNPKLQLNTKLGFIHSVWFQLLQAVSKMNVCVCDSCGKIYIRKGRKPARGRNNFCSDCGERGRATKRIWAQKNAK